MRKFVIFILLIIVALFICLPIFILWKHANINEEQCYGIPELLYYSAQVVGALSTAMAVIIALFGKEIRAIIFNEHFSLSLVEGGFIENLGNTKNDPNPISQSYDCVLSITNDGSKEISDIQILLKEVHYRDSKSGKFKNIITLDNKRLYWSTPENTKTQLLRGDTKKVPLFKIYPEDSCQTPDRSTYSDLRMRIIGCRLDKKYSKRGTWKALYQLQSNEKILRTFECIVEWDGKWCNRLTEMEDGLNANIKTL